MCESTAAFAYSILAENRGKNMWIVKTKTGKFKFVDNYKNPLTQRYQEVSVTFGKNNNQVKKKAQLLLDEKIRKRLIDLQTGNTDITFEQLTDKYISVAKQQLAHTTWYRKKTTLQKINREWGTKIIAKNITSQFINKYLDSLLYDNPCHYSNGTVNSYKSCISGVFDLGIRYGYISKNPVNQVKITWKSQSKKRHEEIENKYLEDDEYAKILAYCDKHNRQDLKDLFIWLYNTGMRCGEAIALQKKNILQDKDGNYFARVEGTLIFIKGEKKLSERYRKTKNAKTFSGDRDVYLPPEAKKIALDHCKGKKANDYIFTSKWYHNNYFSISSIDRMLKTIAKKEEIHKNLVTHIFRHTHVSKLAEQGWPLNVIQHRVGHSNSTITQKIYLHITNKVKNTAIERLKNFPDSQTILQEDKNKSKLKVVKNK